jgi:hypothetical protein
MALARTVTRDRRFESGILMFGVLLLVETVVTSEFSIVVIIFSVALIAISAASLIFPDWVRITDERTTHRAIYVIWFSDLLALVVLIVQVI